MTNRPAIPFQHWSLRVGRPDPQTGQIPQFWGEIVVAVDDVDQSIANIIMTPKRSVPTEPEKGCDIYPYIDRLPDEAIPNLIREIWDALTMWEPRIEVQNVEIVQTAFSQFSCDVFWRAVESVIDEELRKTTVTFGSGNYWQREAA